nr:isoform 2 of snf1-related protein kinase catalytic subunit alpha kin10 [Quercus suber]
MEGSIIGEKYKLGKIIGRGAFGKVRIATDIQTTCEVAVKILVRETMVKKKMEEIVYREIEILRSLRHPHIIRLYEVIDTPKEIYFVMEYAKKGDLLEYILDMGKLQEEEARKIFQQIISGVEYCHENYVVHRDLKPDNLLLDSEQNVKITDFGLSNIMSDGQGFTTRCGSPDYVAPEAGISTFPSHLSPTARDLISKMLTVNPVERIEIPMIRKHQWFQAHLP